VSRRDQLDPKAEISLEEAARLSGLPIPMIDMGVMMGWLKPVDTLADGGSIYTLQSVEFLKRKFVRRYNRRVRKEWRVAQ
jgi:hypothetical protein